MKSKLSTSNWSHFATSYVIFLALKRVALEESF